MNNLKQLRIQRGLTQLALQMKTGIDQAILSKYETGDRIPTVENLIILAEFFNTNLEYLLDRTDYIDPLPKKMQDKPNAL